MNMKIGFSSLYILNIISKSINFIFFYLLLRNMGENEFSSFVVIYTLALSFTQGFSGLYERQRLVERKLSEILYVSDNLVVVITMQVFTIIYLIFFSLNSLNIALILMMNIALYLFQLARIECQSRSDFLGYALLDIIKNLVWLLFGVGLFFCDFSYVVLIFLMSVSCLILVIYKIKVAFFYTLKLKTSILMYKKRFCLVMYSVATSVIPMLPMVLSTLMDDDITTSALGVSYRFQALLSLVVVTLNTIAISRYTEDKGSDYITLSMIFKMSLLFLIAIILMFYLIPFIDKNYFSESRVMFFWLSINSFVSLIGVRYVNRILASAMYKHLFLNYFMSVIAGACSFLVLAHYFNIVYSSLVSLSIVYIINFLGNYFKKIEFSEEFN